jgi:hypothetical protein
VCCHKKNYRAGETEETVWGVVSELMRDPEQLRVDLDRMIEQERRSMRGYPEKEAETWLRELSEADRKRSGFQDLAAEGLITIDELREKLTELDKIGAGQGHGARDVRAEGTGGFGRPHIRRAPPVLSNAQGSGNRLR